MSTFVARVKKGASAALAVAVVSTGFTVVSATSADAQWRPRGGYGHAYRPNRGNRGVGVAAGIIGGLAAGALIAGASRPAYAAPSYGYGYAQPEYGYSQPSYGYAQPSYGYSQPSYAYAQPVYNNYGEQHYRRACYFKKVRQVVDEDTIVIRRVRVCR
jgi:hypothetical protein